MADSGIIETERLRIHPFSEIFMTARYVAWLNDPEVVKYSDQRRHVHTLESCRKYLASYSDSPHFFWAVEARDSNLAHIGNLNAYVDTIHLVADVGILMGEKAAWGKGLGREAFVAVCRYLLHEAGMRKVTAGTLAANTRMVRLMKRAGMVDDGRRVRHCLFEEQEVDVIHTAFFREQLAVSTTWCS